MPKPLWTRLSAYNDLGFDVMFHGDDWKGSDIYNEAEAQLKKGA